MLYPIELWVQPKAGKVTGRTLSVQVIYAAFLPALIPVPEPLLHLHCGSGHGSGESPVNSNTLPG